MVDSMGYSPLFPYKELKLIPEDWDEEGEEEEEERFYSYSIIPIPTSQRAQTWALSM